MAKKSFQEKIQLQIEAVSDRGCVRNRNEDMILVGESRVRDGYFSLSKSVSATDCWVISIADGMGGQRGGDIASEMTIGNLCSLVASLPSGMSRERLYDCFADWVQRTHRELIKGGDSEPELYGMGTTLTGLLIYEGSLYTFNVGDSHIYRYRDGVLRQLTVDHSLRNKMGDMSLPANAIYNSIGGGSAVFIDMEEVKSQPFVDDLFLLCSDGLYDMLPDEEIERLLLSRSSLTSLMDSTKAAGGFDNISIALVKITRLD